MKRFQNSERNIIENMCANKYLYIYRRDIDIKNNSFYIHL